MSDIKALRENATVSGEGGYGLDVQPRSYELAQLQAKMQRLVDGTDQLTWKEMQSILRELVKDA